VDHWRDDAPGNWGGVDLLADFSVVVCGVDIDRNRFGRGNRGNHLKQKQLSTGYKRYKPGRMGAKYGDQ
jgi:hypothetical protein